MRRWWYPRRRSDGNYLLRLADENKSMSKLLDACRTNADVPDIWHDAQCGCGFQNGWYRQLPKLSPMSLTCASYKVFAQILLKRLKDAGCEALLWKTQLGFRSGYGTQDALFAARRHLEEMWATKNGSIAMLALDWSSAFDSVSPEWLAYALRPFGMPRHFISVILTFYEARRLFVQDAVNSLSWHRQKYGISQRCPLEPISAGYNDDSATTICWRRSWGFARNMFIDERTCPLWWYSFGRLRSGPMAILHVCDWRNCRELGVAFQWGGTRAGENEDAQGKFANMTEAQLRAWCAWSTLAALSHQRAIAKRNWIEGLAQPKQIFQALHVIWTQCN